MKEWIILNRITHLKKHFTSTLYQICETNFNLKLEKNTFAIIEIGDWNHMLMMFCVSISQATMHQISEDLFNNLEQSRNHNENLKMVSREFINEEL